MAMRRGGPVRLLGLAAGFAACLAALGGAAPARADEMAGVLAANAAFYAALNLMFTGDNSGIEAIWSHADDITYMGPTGQREHGWKAVLADWQGQAAMKLGGEVLPTDVRVILGSDLAVVSGYEEGRNTNAQGKVETLRLRATNVFRKEDGVWKMVLHQTDTLPYLKK